MLKRLRPHGTRYLVTPAWTYLACGCVWLALGAVQSDPVPGLVIAGAIGLLCLRFFVRAGLYVTSTGLNCVPVSGTTTFYDWSTVAGFHVADLARSARGFGIYAELIDGSEVLLPTTRGWAGLRPKIDRACQALEYACDRARSRRPPALAMAISTTPEALTPHRPLKKIFWDTLEKKLLFVGLWGGVVVLFVASLVYR